MKPSSEVVPGLLVIQIQIQAVCILFANNFEEFCLSKYAIQKLLPLHF